MDSSIQRTLSSPKSIRQQLGPRHTNVLPILRSSTFDPQRQLTGGGETTTKLLRKDLQTLGFPVPQERDKPRLLCRIILPRRDENTDLR
jgi:hypothetical protein